MRFIQWLTHWIVYRGDEAMKDYTFKPAIRENVSLILALAGGTGSGKTYSAMRLAVGMAGGKRFAVVDTENGRASHYADQFAFDVCDLRAPFRPDAYAAAIKAADQAGYPVIVVDSASHEHAGDGGLLDWHDEELDRMAGDDWKKRESCKMTAWIKPKMAHKHMMNALLQVKAHLILCFRAEEKIEMVRGENGKMEVRAKSSPVGKDGWCPICEKNLPFEATCSFLLLATNPGVPHPIKLQAQHRAIFEAGKPIEEQNGQELAQWAAGGHGKSLTATHLTELSTGMDKNFFYDRSADLDILKADYDKRLDRAKTFKDSAAIRDEVLRSDLPLDYKDGFKLKMQAKFQEKLYP